MALEDRIKEARKAARLTQQQAAALIGVAKSTWAGYESGNSTPDIDKLVKIMEILHVDANYLWQDYNQEETKKAPTPDTGMREEDKQLSADLRTLLEKHGLVGADGDISAEQADVIFYTVALLRAALKKGS